MALREAPIVGRVSDLGYGEEIWTFVFGDDGEEVDLIGTVDELSAVRSMDDLPSELDGYYEPMPLVDSYRRL